MASIEEDGFGGAGVMFFLSQSLLWTKRHSATAPQRHSATAPQRHSATAPQRQLIYFFNFIFLNSMLMLVVAGCGWRGIQGLPQASSLSAAKEVGERSSLPLVPSETNLNLGQVAPGNQKTLAFWLTNPSAVPVEVVEITSSCDCLTTELPKRFLAPGQTVEGRMELDLRKEPHFLGNLGIIVSGRGKGSEKVFEIQVHVAVVND